MSVSVGGWRCWALLPVVGLLACSGPSEDDDTTTEPVVEPGLELGTGEGSFEPVADGDQLYIIKGPQGGFHFLGAFEVSGIDPGGALGDPNNPIVEFSVYNGNDRVDLYGDPGDLGGYNPNTFQEGLRETSEAGVYRLLNRFVVLDIPSDSVLDGETLEIRLKVTDVSGLVLEDSVQIVGEPHPNNNIGF